MKQRLQTRLTDDAEIRDSNNKEECITRVLKALIEWAIFTVFFSILPAVMCLFLKYIFEPDKWDLTKFSSDFLFAALLVSLVSMKDAITCLKGAKENSYTEIMLCITIAIAYIGAMLACFMEVAIMIPEIIESVTVDRKSVV